MISVYSYENACKVLDLFVNNQIIALKIYLNESLGKENAKYVFDFKTFEDYPQEEHVHLRSLFNEKNFNSIVKATKNLNDFITMMEIDNVKHYSFEYEIGKTLKETKVLKKTPEEIYMPDMNTSYQNFISSFEKFVIQSGVYKMEIPGLFEKSSNTGKQRGNKYAQVSFEHLINKMKDVILDDNSNAR